MRLLNLSTKQLELLHHRPPPHYAIVSHRWGDESEEVLFTDIGDPARAQSKNKGYAKIEGACEQARREELTYVWLDTCCIDKSNSTELGEAINSMYRWYRNSDVCYAYLHDVGDPSKFTESDWFSRGWTLQELIAPKRLKFFTKDWTLIGTREELIVPIAERTGINNVILRSGKIPPEVTISQKMVWAARRETSKVEDRAYSMLGILDVNMVTNYGIEDGAFEELQHRLILRYDDQTLFAWHRTVVQHDDVEMVDGETIPEPAPEPVSEQATEPDDTGTPSANTTGLLASSPSQYLKSYEISEDDFRKYYVDGIRDERYRSYFSISNNLVHILAPIKHMEGKIWKAVLRCSLEPPGGDQPQRPLVIYLEETQPSKYYRVHQVAHTEQEGDESVDKMNVAMGVPGSLERLGDAESHLEGYILRYIDVVGRHEDNCLNDPRPPAEDPDTLPEPTEAERIARLPRHPPGIKTINVVVCGEPGVAAGRVINLIIGDTIIKPLADYEREPMAITSIDATLRSKHIRILYVIGPRDPRLDLQGCHTALRNMYQLVGKVKEAGGIHLVLMCMIGSKITAGMESNYRLFCEYVCDGQVPTVLIVTGLGKTKRMEDWWDEHKDDRELRTMRFLRHACITVLRGENEEHARKYKDSMQTIQQMLVDFMDGLEATPRVYCPEDGVRWFVCMGKRLTDNLLLRGLKECLKQEAIAKALKEGDGLADAVADELARRLFDHTMET